MYTSDHHRLSRRTPSFTRYGLVDDAVVLAEGAGPYAQREGLGLARGYREVHRSHSFTWQASSPGLLTSTLHTQFHLCPFADLPVPVKAIQLSRHSETLPRRWRRLDHGSRPCSRILMVLTMTSPHSRWYEIGSRSRSSFPDGAGENALGRMFLVCFFAADERADCWCAVTLADGIPSFCVESGDRRQNAVARVCEIKIIDAATAGVGLQVGERSQLCYRGFVVMAGYYKMVEKTT